MKMNKPLIIFLKEWTRYTLTLFKTFTMTSLAKDLEILALMSQLSVYQQQVENKKIKKPKLTPAFRQLWVLLSRFLPNWATVILTAKPKTVIGWRATAFKTYWTKKSKKIGRPPISKEMILLIKKIHKENPMLKAEKIHELLVSMNILNAPAPNTISKYLPELKKPPSERQIQSWKTFLKNHSTDIWAMDYLVVPTIRFKLLYILIIINHATRKIEHFAVTSNPNSTWLKQQIRNATPYNHKPKYLIHDNDPAFVSQDFRSFLDSCGIKSKRTTYYSPWQNGIAERMNGILRQELLNHIIPFNERHLTSLLSQYIHEYYNTHRTHQGINCKTPIPLPTYLPTTVSNTKLKKKPVLGGMYHTYKKVA